MNLPAPKHSLCSHDHGLGVLLVDIKTEMIPRKDRRGNWQYYCLKGHHVFGIPSGEVIVSTEVAKAKEERVTSMV
ncbi:hypothetical protein KDI_46690 [Dictyobacter arantiisoli]|uniref:Uncharacterized protein n=2 Tax=Dictyobacter arantiisoli TaxID=2014874 RepID=A0A5A5TIQ4_9CHLR|nr:hypothetical protein KDI_46690 [Dictyobacter arantiisoli]